MKLIILVTLLFSFVSDITSSSEIAIFQTIKLVKSDILPDGTYGPRILNHATAAVQQDFDLTVQMITENSPVDDFALNESFKVVKNIIEGIKIGKIKEYLIQNLISEYTKRCVGHILTAATISEQKRAAAKITAHAVKILVYECYRMNISIPTKKALKLFEILYLYGEDGYRYQVALSKIFQSIDNANLPLFYGKIEEIFDPMRPKFPTFASTAKHTDESYSLFANFLAKINEKVNTTVDPSVYPLIFNAHMNTIITSLLMDIRCEAFLDIFLDVLPRINKIALFKTDQFYENWNNIISDAVKDNSKVLNALIDNFLTAETILAMPEDIYINFGSILSKVTCDRTDISAKIVRLEKAFTREVKTKYNAIKDAFNKFDRMAFRERTLGFHKLSFKSYTAATLHTLSQETTELNQYIPELLKYKHKFIDNAEVLMKELVEKVLDDPGTQELNAERFAFLLSFLNYCGKLKLPVPKMFEPFLLLLKYYNLHVIPLLSHRNLVISIKSYLKALINSSLVPKTFEDYEIIYDFYRKTADESIAYIEFSKIIPSILKKAPVIEETLNILHQFCEAKEFPLLPAIIAHIVEEIELYRQQKASGTTSTFNKQRLRSLINVITDKYLLSRTETAILNKLYLKGFN